MLQVWKTPEARRLTTAMRKTPEARRLTTAMRKIGLGKDLQMSFD